MPNTSAATISCTDTDSIAEHSSQRVEHGTPIRPRPLDYVNDHSSLSDGFDNYLSVEVGRYVCTNSVMVIAMARSRPTPDAGIRRRPKDRKAQIARASAEAFSALGYHAVSMEAIASRVGISATALYRHYPSKYDLFRDAVLALGEQLVECTAFADEAPRRRGDPAAAGRRDHRHRTGQSRVGRPLPVGGALSARRRPDHAQRPDANGQPPNSSAAHGTSAGAQLATALDAVVVDAERDRQHRRPSRQAARRPHSCRAGRNRHRHLDGRRARPARRVRRRRARAEADGRRPVEIRSAADRVGAVCSTARATATPRWRRSRRRSASRRRGSTGTSPARTTSSPRYTGGPPIGCRLRPRRSSGVSPIRKRR